MDKTIKLKITGKGHPMSGEWKVEDIETGAELSVKSITIHADVSGESARCVIELAAGTFEIDIEGEATVING